jgi:hypothetical protein
MGSWARSVSSRAAPSVPVYRVRRSADVGQPGIPLREPRTVKVHVKQGRCWEPSRKLCPMKCPVTGRETGRSASCVPAPDGIVFVPVQLRSYG